MEEGPKMPKEEIGDKKIQQKKKSAKAEMPTHFVLSEKEYKEEMRQRRENPHWWREQK